MLPQPSIYQYETITQTTRLHYIIPHQCTDFDTALAEIIHRSADNAVIVLVTEDIVEWNDIIYRRVLAKLSKLQVQEGEEGEKVEKNDAVKEQAAKTLLAKRLRFIGFAHYRCVGVFYIDQRDHSMSTI